jgi:hypothetical protein
VTWTGSQEDQAKLQSEALANLPSHAQARVNSSDYMKPKVYNYENQEQLFYEKRKIIERNLEYFVARTETLATVEAASMDESARLQYILANPDWFGVKTKPEIQLSFKTNPPEHISVSPAAPTQQVESRGLTADPAFVEQYIKHQVHLLHGRHNNPNLAGFFFPGTASEGPSIHVWLLGASPIVFLHEWIHSLQHRSWDDAMVRTVSGHTLSEAVTTYYTRSATEDMLFFSPGGDILIDAETAKYAAWADQLTDHIAKGDFTKDDLSAAYFNGDQAAISKIIAAWEAQ